MTERISDTQEPTWEGKDLGLPPPLPAEYDVYGIPDPEEDDFPEPPLPQEGMDIFPVNIEEQPFGESESREGNSELAESVPVLDRSLMSLGLGDGGIYSEKWAPRLAEFIDEKRNMSAGESVELYHGLNGAGLEKALETLDSPDQGVRQISGPTLCVYPAGQFWKPGGAGLKYSIPREQLEFSGEDNPNAKFHVLEDGNVEMINGLEAMSFSEFKGEVLRTERKEDIYADDVDPRYDTSVEPIGEKIVPLSKKEKEIEAQIREKLNIFSQDRQTKKEIRDIEASLQQKFEPT